MLQINRESGEPVFRQISDQLVHAIRKGMLAPGAKLPGTRILASFLKVHRKTVIAAYDDLNLHGWIIVSPYKGAVVADRLAPLPEHPETKEQPMLRYPVTTGYSFIPNVLLDRTALPSGKAFQLTDGLPDVRITPIVKLSTIYNRLVKRKQTARYLNYTYGKPNDYFLEILAKYLNNTRGLAITKNNVLISRSVHMGLFLAASTLLNAGDNVIIGAYSYYIANMIIQQSGASLVQVPVDDDGLCVDDIEKICREKNIRVVYITPHSHYPTTAVLSAERRQRLLQLSARYGFIIIEDDYDFDFQFDHQPQLPVACADNEGMVIYIGSFAKSLAPGFALSYLVAPENLITELSKFSTLLAGYGDNITEQSIAEFIVDGEMHRHMDKSRKIYRNRRDLMCDLITEELGEYVEFIKPEAGLAVWTRWDKSINLSKISRECADHGLTLPQHLLYQSRREAAMRIGFANLNAEELKNAVQTLKYAVAKRN
ncbi:PLP-dependent aminotransferase family protein [Chitinophaga sp.]|uniref:aminotransferase-like domain-containing protein n=1 Tax=Chitinophaga sp. TaxID=1869181 RepID=UPI002D805B97|nr:PLP-dependent aminotransferase family protein [Chitinophaga sp.]